VRGQTARLIPQDDVRYGVQYRGHNLSMVPRRDGILVQAQSDGDFNNPDATPDRAATTIVSASARRIPSTSSPPREPARAPPATTV
jgi:flagellar motor protein MotB